MEAMQERGGWSAWPRSVRVTLIGLSIGAVLLGSLAMAGHAKAAALVREGDALMAKGKYEEARVTYQAAQRYWPPGQDELGLKIAAAERQLVLAATPIAEPVAETTDQPAEPPTADPVKPKSTKKASSAAAPSASTPSTSSDAVSDDTPSSSSDESSSGESAPHQETPSSSSDSGSSDSGQSNTAPSTPSCTSNTSPMFTHHITDLTKVAKVVSPPTKAGTDLKPHGYVDTQLNAVPVYAPVAATLDSGAFYQEGNPGGEYLLIFKVSCEVTFRFDHITSPVQSIKDAFPTKQSDTRTSAPATTLSFTAGEQIATTTGTIYGIWDFGVYNSSTSNRYANDSTYNWSTNNTTAVCPWGYYSASTYAEYKALFGSLSGNPADGDPFCS
ncbi:hypothetical protein HY374_00765 [Candidatus Berkelbacteria bacterium]|nr:hypothetical protein [Candidatus Berkelbacteria bacterium]